MNWTDYDVVNIEEVRDFLIDKRREEFTQKLQEDVDFLKGVVTWGSEGIGYTGVGNMNDQSLLMALKSSDLLQEALDKGLITYRINDEALLDTFLEQKVNEAMDDPEWHIRQLYKLHVVPGKIHVHDMLQELNEDRREAFLKDNAERHKEDEL